jgi:hypothetical protein
VLFAAPSPPPYQRGDASDYPFVGCEREVTQRQTVDWMIRCVPDPHIRRKKFGETALRFYFRESAQRTLHGRNSTDGNPRPGSMRWPLFCLDRTSYSISRKL